MNRKIRGAVRGSAVHRLIAEELPVTSPMTSPGPTTCAPLLRAALCLRLGSSGRAPQRTGICTIRIKLQHPVVELARRFRRVVQPNEVTDVLGGFFHLFLTAFFSGGVVFACAC